MKNRALLLFMVIFLTSFSYGQPVDEIESHVQPPVVKHMISLVPQYLLINGLRVDYDLRLDQNHWIQFAPTFYLRNNELSHADFESDFRHLIGGGLHVYHRFYPGKGLFDQKVYISWGGVYQNYNITYDESFENTVMERYTRIRKFGGDVIIGINTRLFDPLRIDFYTGMGLRHSQFDSDAKKPEKFDDVYFGYGYSGTILIMGLRISLPL